MNRKLLLFISLSQWKKYIYIIEVAKIGDLALNGLSEIFPLLNICMHLVFYVNS